MSWGEVVISCPNSPQERVSNPPVKGAPGQRWCQGLVGAIGRCLSRWWCRGAHSPVCNPGGIWFQCKEKTPLSVSVGAQEMCWGVGRE